MVGWILWRGIYFREMNQLFQDCTVVLYHQAVRNGRRVEWKSQYSPRHTYFNPPIWPTQCELRFRSKLQHCATTIEPYILKCSAISMLCFGWMPLISKNDIRFVDRSVIQRLKRCYLPTELNGRPDDHVRDRFDWTWKVRPVSFTLCTYLDLIMMLATVDQRVT